MRGCAGGKEKERASKEKGSPKEKLMDAGACSRRLLLAVSATVPREQSRRLLSTISAIIRVHLGESRRLAERAAVVITPSQLARRRIGPIGDGHVAARRCFGEFGEFIRR